MPWDFAVILTILAIAVPWLGQRRIRDLMQLPETTKMDRLALYASTIAFQCAAAGVVLWRTSARGIRPAQLGLALPSPILTVVAAAGLTALILTNQLVSVRQIGRTPAKASSVVHQLARKVFPQDGAERLGFFALVAIVAACEEIVYRGFVQRAFQDLSGGDIAVGVIGSAVMFGLAHLYQGPRGLFSTFAVGLLFSIVRAWTGSLLAPVVTHFIADLTVGFLAPAKLRGSVEEASASD